MTHLTKDQQKQLLMLTESKWKRLQSDVLKHYRLGINMTSEYTFLLALTSEQWHSVNMELTKLRIDNKEVLSSLRKETRQQARRIKKTEYMREYMRNYRQRKEAPYGQVCNQNSS